MKYDRAPMSDTPLPGYVGYTDYYWFRHCRRLAVRDAAWWRPFASEPLSLPIHTPFFFNVHIEEGGTDRLIKGWAKTTDVARGTLAELASTYGDRIGSASLDEL